MQTTSARPVGRAAAALAELVRFRIVSSRTASEMVTGEFGASSPRWPGCIPPSTPAWTSNALTARRCCTAGTARERTPLRDRPY